MLAMTRRSWVRRQQIVVLGSRRNTWSSPLHLETALSMNPGTNKQMSHTTNPVVLSSEDRPRCLPCSASCALPSQSGYRIYEQICVCGGTSGECIPHCEELPITSAAPVRVRLFCSVSPVYGTFGLIWVWSIRFISRVRSGAGCAQRVVSRSYK